MTRRIRFVLVLVLAAGLAAAADTAPRVVFSSNRSGQWRIWTMAPDGSAMRQLTRGPEGVSDIDPVIRPDGRAILFTSTRGDTVGVWTMGTDGSKPERLCDGDQAEWAPDRGRIVFRRAGRLLIRDLTSGTETALTPPDWVTCSGPAWSPDGKWIAFARLVNRANAVFLIPADGGEPKVVRDQEGACEPHWSPDGRRLVYETETHICTTNPDGTGNHLVTWYGGVQRYGRFGPDGKSIIFCQGASTGGPWELYTVPAAGGTPAKRTEGGSDMYPHWQ